MLPPTGVEGTVWILGRHSTVGLSTSRPPIPPAHLSTICHVNTITPFITVLLSYCYPGWTGLGCDYMYTATELWLQFYAYGYSN